MDMRTFTEFWKGMFFFVSTLTVSVIFYLVGIMNNGMDRVGDKLSPPDMMMPFTW